MDSARDRQTGRTSLRPNRHSENHLTARGWGFPAVAAGKDEPKMESNVGTPPRISYLTDDLVTQAVEFVKCHRERPFFLYAAFNAPHGPLQATKQDLDLYSFVEDNNRRTHCAMVHRLDLNVGRILDAVASAGIAKNTLIVFISDVRYRAAERCDSVSSGT